MNLFIRAIWNEFATVNWQLAANSISIKNFELATVSQMPFRWSYHKVYMKWIGNCQLAAGCQFDFYQELWIGNCQLSASCQFERATIRGIWNELATGNWQLAANSILSRTLNCQLSTVSQLPIRWTYHKGYMKLSARCHFDEAIIRYVWNELTTVNFDEPIIRAIWNCQPDAISMKLS